MNPIFGNPIFWVKNVVFCLNHLFVLNIHILKKYRQSITDFVRQGIFGTLK